MTSDLTPEQTYVLALEQGRDHAKLLLARLEAMEASGVLGPEALAAVKGWTDRLHATHSLLPAKPDSLKTEQELAANA